MALTSAFPNFRRMRKRGILYSDILCGSSGVVVFVLVLACFVTSPLDGVLFNVADVVFVTSQAGCLGDAVDCSLVASVFRFFSGFVLLLSITVHV